MLKVFDLVIHIFSENGEMILPLGLNWNFHEKDVFLEVPYNNYSKLVQLLSLAHALGHTRTWIRLIFRIL